MRGPPRKKKAGARKIRPTVPKTSPAVHVKPEQFAELKRDTRKSGAPSLAGYVAAALQVVRGRLKWLPDGRVQVMIGVPWPTASRLEREIGNA